MSERRTWQEVKSGRWANDDDATVHRGYAWPPVTVHTHKSIAELWHAVALRRMNDGDQEGAMRAIRTEVNLEWRPGWRQK